MAYSGQFLKVNWGWTAAGTDEIASVGLNFSTVGGIWADAAGALAVLNPAVAGPDFMSHMDALWNSTSFNTATYGELRTVRFAAVGTDGAEIGSAKVFEDTTPAVGGEANVLPQATVACSLLSGSTAGKGNRGRFYLPYTYVTLQSTPSRPTMNTSNQGTAATALQTFINNINIAAATATGSPISVHIMSEAAGVTSKRVEQVAIGNVNDTQRRRRNRLPEVYVTLDIT